MDFKKNVLSEQLLWRRKVFLRLGWGIMSSMIVMTALLLHNSFKSPVVGPLFQGGVYRVSNAASSSSSSFSDSDSGNVEVHVSRDGENHDSMEDNGGGVVKNGGRNEKIGGNGGNERLHSKNHDFKGGNGGGVVLGDVNLGAKNGSFKEVNGGKNEEIRNNGGNKGLDSIITEEEILAVIGNLTEVINNGSLVGENANASIVAKSKENPRNGEGLNSENRKVENLLSNGGGKSSKLDADIRKQGKVLSKGSYEDCDLFDGKWVRGDSGPYYPPGSCPYIDKDFDCQRNGRPDDGYIKWKWQPFGCNVARLNAIDFLERLRGRRLVFVGDSLNRNMWESLVCILRHSVKRKKRVHEISGRSDFKKKGVYAFRFEDYNCSLDFVGAPFLVRESTFKRENGTIETLRLDLMDPSTEMYRDADIMVFNTGHWWTHERTSKGEDYYQEGDRVYPRLKVLKAFQKALRTWARWVDRNIDCTRTQVFFRGYSVTHFWGGQWNSGGQCHKESKPIIDETHLSKYPSKMKALENVIRKAKTPITYLNVSRLTDYRKDAHPSIYRREYKTREEWTAAERSQDCSHWCLPGVPDSWNELLYASLLKTGRGVWGNHN